MRDVRILALNEEGIKLPAPSKCFGQMYFIFPKLESTPLGCNFTLPCNRYVRRRTRSLRVRIMICRLLDTMTTYKPLLYWFIWPRRIRFRQISVKNWMLPLKTLDVRVRAECIVYWIDAIVVPRDICVWVTEVANWFSSVHASHKKYALHELWRMPFVK